MNAECVLDVTGKKRETPVAIERAVGRQAEKTLRCVSLGRRAAQEISKVCESPDAERKRRVNHVVLVALDQSARFNQMTPAIMNDAVFDAENILSKFDADRSLGTKTRDAADINVAERLATWNKRRQILRRL